MTNESLTRVAVHEQLETVQELLDLSKRTLKDADFLEWFTNHLELEGKRQTRRLKHLDNSPLSLHSDINRQG